MQNEKIRNKEINIRLANPDDAAELLEIYRPYVEETAITFEYVAPTIEEFQSRIEDTLKKYPYFVAECDGEIVGYTYASPFKERAAYAWSVETTIYVKVDKKHRKIGTRLYEALEEALNKQGILNVNACIAYTDTEDEYLTNDSVYYHEKIGYKMVGEFHQCGYKFGRWYNMVWMEKMIGEHMANQPPVKSFPEIL
ncbi:MAG: GNAT family N-acetyltransferase [Lachnospiraceae bacterium]|nr:GNAT family N-acetyltransferase [Lachnospiraceae bacterium]